MKKCAMAIIYGALGLSFLLLCLGVLVYGLSSIFLHFFSDPSQAVTGIFNAIWPVIVSAALLIAIIFLYQLESTQKTINSLKEQWHKVFKFLPAPLQKFAQSTGRLIILIFAFLYAIFALPYFAR